jgi:tRNA (guanosine-2'-O-)-methyltransferase
VARTLSPTELKRLHREWRRSTQGRVALLLDAVQTPYNVGAILRTAAAMRVDHLWLVGATESPMHAKTQKTALGAQRYLTWDTCGDVDDAADQVAAAGYTLIGIELAEGASPLHEIELPADVCLAVGHEDRGLSKACLARCRDVGYLPQLGPIASLNVATAAAIAIYEVRRREWARAVRGPTKGGD